MENELNDLEDLDIGNQPSYGEYVQARPNENVPITPDMMADPNLDMDQRPKIKKKKKKKKKVAEMPDEAQIAAEQARLEELERIEAEYEAQVREQERLIAE